MALFAQTRSFSFYIYFWTIHVTLICNGFMRFKQIYHFTAFIFALWVRAFNCIKIVKILYLHVSSSFRTRRKAPPPPGLQPYSLQLKQTTVWSFVFVWKVFEISIHVVCVWLSSVRCLAVSQCDPITFKWKNKQREAKIVPAPIIRTSLSASSGCYVKWCKYLLLGGPRLAQAIWMLG